VGKASSIYPAKHGLLEVKEIYQTKVKVAIYKKEEDKMVDITTRVRVMK
jgi:hypothetical protein